MRPRTEHMKLRPEQVEQEIRRLAPWYYLWELEGVRTDIVPPVDETGFRQVETPAVMEGFWRGKSVLDVGCNEGAYGLGALGHGAASLTGFDTRPINVEKARFVAGLRGHESAEFHVATCDSWVRAHPGKQFDVVMLYGILYHLPEPQRTIREYCALAREWVFVSCCLFDLLGVDGYTWTTETENVAASDAALDSLMPNTALSLIREFRQNGFEPVYIEEVKRDDFWDGCNLILRRADDAPWRRAPLPGARAEVEVMAAVDPMGAAAPQLLLSVYNRQAEACSMQVEIWEDGACEATFSTDLGELPGRCMRAGEPASQARYFTAPLPAATASGLEIRVLSAGCQLGGSRLVPGSGG